eukprot:12924577-Prorocentrum_lima.AAC.1
MNNANTTSDIVALVSIIMEILIVETNDAGKCWRINLHVPASQGQPDAEQQVKSFKDKWIDIRPEVSVEMTAKYHEKGRLLDGAYAEICKSDDSYMVSPLRTTGSM